MNPSERRLAFVVGRAVGAQFDSRRREATVTTERRTYEVALEQWQEELLHQVALGRGRTLEVVLQEITDDGLAALSRVWALAHAAQPGSRGLK